MTPDDLAKHVTEFIERAAGRVTGIGAEQYSRGTEQRFEGMPLADLFAWTEEELEDVAVYAVMLWIRLKRVREQITSLSA